MSELRMPPIGVEDFEEIRRKNCYYVDKTGLIRELLESRAKVTLFTRPRRFGKTLNMSMLQCFLEIGTDPALFDGLAISREGDLCAEHMGKYPVISITLKGVEGRSFDEAREQLAAVIAGEARRLGFLCDSVNLSDSEKGMMLDLQNQKGDLRNSLKRLSEVLYKHFGKKAVILIDEYDVPLDKASQAGYYDEMSDLIRGFLGAALKTNKYLEFAALTGCLRVAKESIFTGLNNLKAYSVLDTKYDEWFGFTDGEVREMLDYYGMEGRLEATRDWYDGYQFGNADVYCPWDVINWCGDLLAEPGMRPKDYWANSSGNGIISHFADMADEATRDEMENLLHGGSVAKKINSGLAYTELYKKIDNVWSIFLYTGYLTCRAQDEDGTCELSIPNREITDLFRQMFEEWFTDMVRTQTKEGKFGSLYIALEEGDTTTAETIIQDCLMESMSFMDVGRTSGHKEMFYHGMLLGILTGCKTWLVRSNREAGKGRADIIAVKRSASMGIIVEVKRTDDPDGLAELSAAALAQIDERDYGAYFRGVNSVGTLRKYGIAFCGKECRMAARG